VGRGVRADQAAMLTYTGGHRAMIRHEAGCVRAEIRSRVRRWSWALARTPRKTDQA